MKRYLLFCIAALLLASCRQQAPTGRRQITVTIEPLRYFTEKIAGGKFSVNTMVPNGGSPETYEPTSEQLLRLAESDLYIKVGNIGFERTWMDRLAQNAPNTRIVDSSKGIVPARSDHHIDDPHTWMSASSAMHIARNIYKALVDIDAKDSTYYKKNYEKLLSVIKATDAEVRRQLKANRASAFLIYHPALTYFARDYGLVQIPAEQEGREPGPAQLHKTIELAKQKGARVMFVQKQFDTRHTQVVGQGAGAREVVIDPLAYDWDKEMMHIAKNLK